MVSFGGEGGNCRFNRKNAVVNENKKYTAIFAFRFKHRFLS